MRGLGKIQVGGTGSEKVMGLEQGGKKVVYGGRKVEG